MLAAALAAALVVPSSAEARTTCRSGKTEFRQGAVRAFSVYDRADDVSSYYACSRRLRRPRLLQPGSPGVTADTRRFEVAHGRLGYVLSSNTDVNATTALGWLDLRTGRRASFVTSEEEGAPVIDFAMTESGGVVYAELDEAETGHVLSSARFGVRRFFKPWQIALEPDRVARGSLAVENDVATWRTARGETRRRGLFPVP